MNQLERLTAALADRYRIERELGQGDGATVLAAESRGSADVAEATTGAGQSSMAFADHAIAPNAIDIYNYILPSIKV